MNVQGVIQNAKSLIAFLFADAFIAEEKQKWPKMAYGLVSLYTIIFPVIESFLPCNYCHIAGVLVTKLLCSPSLVVIACHTMLRQKIIRSDNHSKMVHIQRSDVRVCFLLTTREQSEEANE